MRGGWKWAWLLTLWSPGTADGCQGGRSLTESVVACPGHWEGHIRTAAGLCGEGFHLCEASDRGGSLEGLSWAASELLPGCFAYDAAQDGDRCLPCTHDIASDDLAAFGRDCPHRNAGAGGTCLRQGRIDASCCTDSLRGEACHFRKGITTGVLCCKSKPITTAAATSAPPTPPRLPGPIQSSPSVGERVRVTCPVAPQGEAGVEWWKGGEYIQYLHSASFPIPFARPRHSGLYTCRTRHGDKGHFNLTVQEVGSYACADGTSEGFHDAHNVRACEGTWLGEVRRGGRSLCGPGWRVCGRKDAAFLAATRADYRRDFGGCWAFNAAQRRGKCGGCRSGGARGGLAGLGGDCAVDRAATPSEEGCVGGRWLEAASSKRLGQTPPCHQAPGVDGVLCCRRWSRRERAVARARAGSELRRLPPGFQGDVGGGVGCRPACANGGTCLLDGRCLCAPSFAGQSCQHGGCARRCHNGGRCLLGTCKCPHPFYGPDCALSHRAWLNYSQPRAPPPPPPQLYHNHLTNSIQKL